MTTKFERQGTILRLVQQQHLSTQAEVADALKKQGHWKDDYDAKPAAGAAEANAQAGQGAPR